MNECLGFSIIFRLIVYVYLFDIELTMYYGILVLERTIRGDRTVVHSFQTDEKPLVWEGKKCILKCVTLVTLSSI